MNRLAILGSTSQIARDLIRSAAHAERYDLILYARDTESVATWLAAQGLAGRYVTRAYASYGADDHDAVINFVGVGDPSKAAAMGGSIFDITLKFDQLVLEQLEHAPQRRYIFLSSGAAYGTTFVGPASAETPAKIDINSLTPQEYYSVAKLHAECRHRSLGHFPIVDLRIFNYFSRTQDLNARFFITDLLRAIQNGTVLKTSSDSMMRDYMHPDDFYDLVDCILQTPPQNSVLDCYSRAPVEKFTLLQAMAERLGLQYEVAPDSASSINATGAKPYYYSINHHAKAFGYRPRYSSLDTVLIEGGAALARPSNSGIAPSHAMPGKETT